MRLRFTIRDLLWLTLVVAMGVGWWLDHSRHSIQYGTGIGPESTLKGWFYFDR
jgi:hypothetical protein